MINKHLESCPLIESVDIRTRGLIMSVLWLNDGVISRKEPCERGIERIFRDRTSLSSQHRKFL
jgi:hypothetical protein